MITAKRPQYKVKSLLTDNEIFGVGLVTVNWSSLENAIDLWILIATGKNYDSGRGQRTSFKERAAHLKAESTSQLRPEWSSCYIGVLDKALSVKNDRDQVVHWVWSHDDQRQPGVLNPPEPGRWQSRRIGYDKLLSVAAKIDNITAELNGISIEAGLANGKTDNFLGSECWQLMCK